ncbi:hypothetical protein Cpir12675_000548 [Ceratocystis pirilliformis]|uniref:Uncharacterized protein n=1 Tax=Ceratocystis pirilliformis TaxID=259994 RepID=A0ABR3ZKV6_9PEZI
MDREDATADAPVALPVTYVETIHVDVEMDTEVQTGPEAEPAPPTSIEEPAVPREPTCARRQSRRSAGGCHGEEYINRETRHGRRPRPQTQERGEIRGPAHLEGA